jgi:tetratricopeptide (TPR) repeat protein
MKHPGSFWMERSGMYIPLTYTTWGVIKKITSPNQFNPTPFHFLNVITHSMNGVLLFYLLLVFFKNKSSAFWGTLLFLIHPMQVESVSWISEFRGLYSTLFCFSSLLFFFQNLEEKMTFQKLCFSRNFWLAFTFFVLALLAKPSGIILPFVIGILTWRFYKDKLPTVWKALLIWLLPVFVISSLLIAKNPESSITWWNRCLVAGYSLFFYIQKIITPFPLVACYGYTPDIVVSNPFSFIALFACILLLVFLYLKRNSLPDLFTAFMIIVVCVFPVLGFISFEYQHYSTVADRYIYMGLMGVALLVPTFEKFIRKNPFLNMMGGFFLVILLILTIKQTGTWQNEFTLWNHSLHFCNNSAKAYYNRGVEYSLKKDFQKAIDDYTHALVIEPTYTDALFNRANAYENTGDDLAALGDYNKAIQLNPKAGDVYYKRSYLFYKAGKLDEALDDLQRAEGLKFPINRRYKEMLMNLKFNPKH